MFKINSTLLYQTLFYTIFIISHIGLFVYGFFKQKGDPELSTLNQLGASVYTSRGAGLVLALDCTLILIPMCRVSLSFARSFFSWIDHNTYFHQLVAYSILFFTLIHVNAHYINFFNVEYKLYSVLQLKTWQVHYQTAAGITGHLMLIIMYFMYTTASKSVRKKNYEMFWYTHHLYNAFFICLFFHSFGCFVKSNKTGQCKSYNTNYYAVPVFLFYTLERVYRWYLSRMDTKFNAALIHPGKTLELRFQKLDLTYKPGQYVYLNLPIISNWQWHPFTLTSAPQEPFLSVHIRCEGDWTSAMYDFFSKLNQYQVPKMFIDGPYGAPSQDLFKYEEAALISGGIGVTPSASLLKHVWFSHLENPKMKLRKLYFIWISREKESFEWFQSLLSTLERSLPSSFLEIEVYLTGSLCIDDIQNIVLNDPASIVDPITKLKSRCHYGRPIWSKIFTRFKQNQLREKNGKFGVFFCGPKPLGKVIQNACIKESNQEVEFIPHLEHF